MKVRVIVLLACSLVAVGSGFCPPPEAVFPCTCDSERSALSCSSPSYTHLQRALTSLRTYPGGQNIYRLDIKDDYTASYLPGAQLTGVEMSILSVETSALQSFHDRVNNKSFFEGIEDTVSTIHLTYHKNYIDDFEFTSLSPLKKLMFLSIKGMFTAVAEALPRLPSVTQFWFDTPASYLVKGAFAGLTGIEEMRMFLPEMRAYKRDMFPRPATSLHMWTVKSDKVTELPNDYLEEMPSLRYLEIPRNVNNIPPLIATPSLYVQGSFNLTCDCKLKWLARMRDENKIGHVSALCVRPEQVRYREFKDIREDQLTC